jgi:hypothetical protein
MRIIVLALLLAGCYSPPKGKPECEAAYQRASAEEYKGNTPIEALMNAISKAHEAFDRCSSGK